MSLVVVGSVVGQFVILTKEESQREHIEMLRSSA